MYGEAAWFGGWLGTDWMGSLGRWKCGGGLFESSGILYCLETRRLLLIRGNGIQLHNVYEAAVTSQGPGRFWCECVFILLEWMYCIYRVIKHLDPSTMSAFSKQVAYACAV